MYLKMTSQDMQGIIIYLAILIVFWIIYNISHSDNKLLQAIVSFWLGAMLFMGLFYVLFSYPVTK